jgi:hypothetical protein
VAAGSPIDSVASAQGVSLALVASLLLCPLATSPTGCPGRSGNAAIKPAPALATPNDKPTGHEDHDLRLEY